MARRTKQEKNGAALGFEATLWHAADKLRNNLDAAEYQRVVLEQSMENLAGGMHPGAACRN